MYNDFRQSYFPASVSQWNCANYSGETSGKSENINLAVEIKSVSVKIVNSDFYIFSSDYLSYEINGITCKKISNAGGSV